MTGGGTGVDGDGLRQAQHATRSVLMATILIADDYAVNRDYLGTLLGAAGHRVLEAADGARALELARSERPDLVISDMVMAGTDGFELARLLRASPETASIPVIFCTATYLEDEAMALARMCGVREVLMKPCPPENVLRAVQAALRGGA